MVFTAAERYRIFSLSSYAVTRYITVQGFVIDPLYINSYRLTREEIWARLDQVEADGPEAVDEVRSLLADLTTAREALKTAQLSSGDRYLIQADVLKWAVGDKSVGLHELWNDAVDRLRFLLGYPPLVLLYGGGQGGGAYLMRS